MTGRSLPRSWANTSSEYGPTGASLDCRSNPRTSPSFARFSASQGVKSLASFGQPSLRSTFWMSLNACCSVTGSLLLFSLSVRRRQFLEFTRGGIVWASSRLKLLSAIRSGPPRPETQHGKVKGPGGTWGGQPPSCVGNPQPTTPVFPPRSGPSDGTGTRDATNPLRPRAHRPLAGQIAPHGASSSGRMKHGA